MEKEIVHEVVRGDKHNLRKSANFKAQISVHSEHCTDLFFAICKFSQVVFVTSNNFTHNLLLMPFFRYCIGSVLAVLCSGMHFFTWAAGRSQLSLFVGLAAGLWCFTAGCHVKSLPLPPTPLSHRSVLHDGRKHRTVIFLQSNAVRE